MLKPFLNKYDTIIFDMDGVITSEQAYWNCAALAVFEYFNQQKNTKTDAKYCIDNVAKIRADIFYNDKIIVTLKEKGVNSNWDLAYIRVCAQIILKSENSEEIYNYIKQLDDNAFELYTNISKAVANAMNKSVEYTKRNGELWTYIQMLFQEWYLGDEIFNETYNKKTTNQGKIGFIYDEKPFIDLNILKNLLSELSASKRLCIGTGRVYNEIALPLSKWDCLKYFSEDGRINYDFVSNAEHKFNVTLTKPNPYMFLKALYGEDYSDEKLIKGDYDKEKIKSTLVVGDAGSDMFAAQAMDADFCAVLTGVLGQKARGYFEENNATYILNSVVDFIE